MDQDLAAVAPNPGGALCNRPLSRGGAELADCVRRLYAEGQTDYAIEPLVLVDGYGQPVGRIADEDAVIFCCRRGEREIELTEAFTEASFPHFPRPAFRHLPFVILTLYHEKFKDLPVAFLPTRIPDTLGEVISRAGLRQLHVSESEKFAHITFFLNGGQHQPFPGEVDVSLPSPKGIPFDQVPALSLPQVAAQVIEGLRRGYDLIAANFANGDVLGHTASRDAKLQCAARVDMHLARVVEAASASGYVTLITADHGNLETLWNEDGTPHVAHTSNPVACILVDPLRQAPLHLRDGKLADVAPTILSALGVAQPSAMDGVSLVPGAAWGGKRKALLLILDGWGIGTQDETNPIYAAPTPYWDDLLQRHPSSRLQAFGEAVGLQAGKAGNSEAGHLNLGAGRVVLQDDVRLDLALQDGSFYTNETFQRVMQDVIGRKSSLHLIALLSERSSHGSIAYPLALLRMAKACGVRQVYVHVIFDGRSTEPGTAPALLEKLEAEMHTIGLGQIVSGIGRGIALDRDGNYAKIQRTFEALVFGQGRKVSAAV